MGFSIHVVYSVTKPCKLVGGVEATANGVKYNDSLTAYAPVFTTLKSVGTDGAYTGYEAKGDCLYKTRDGVSLSNQLMTAPVEGETYYSRIILENPEGNHHIEKNLVNITIPGYEVEFLQAYERDMGFSIHVVYSVTHKTHIGGTATCTAKAECSVCGEAYGSLKAHTYRNVTTKATLSKNGKVESKCSVCGNVSKTTTVYYPKTIKLSYSSTTYNGKTKKPTVTVKDSKGNTLKEGTDYTVKYESGRKVPGKYTVTITFKGKYEGKKVLTLTIKPKAPSISSLYSKTKGKAVIKWTNVTGESGFQVYYATSKGGTYKKVKSYSANKTAGSKTKLKSGKKYYFKVRAYKKTSSGTVYSSWSSVKSVKIK